MGTISRRSFVGGAALLATSRAGAQSSSAWLEGASSEWDRIFKAAQAEGQVTVAGFPALADAVSAAFERDTGIRLSFLGGNTSEQSARLEAEARAKNLTIDILLGGGRELAPLMQEGFLQPIAPQLLLPGVGPQNFRQGKLKWMDNASQYLMQGANYVYGWLVVNKDQVGAGEIRSWKDLLNTKYRGKITSYDVRTTGPGQGSAAWLSEVFGLDYVKDLFLGQAVKFTIDSRGLVEGAVRGTSPIVFGAIQSEVERFGKAGFSNLAVVLPSDGPGYLTGGFSVLKQARGVPHPNAATVFINWYMSRPGQEVYSPVMLETSRRIDVDKNVPDYLIPQPGIDYYDSYAEDVYFRRINEAKRIVEAMGSR
jgi:ABC-type Fe3+ transport system substrate-binding protein